MKTQLLVTVVGEDKPGIVARVTKLFVANGANLEESRMAILGGEFAAIMLVTAEDAKLAELKTSLEKLTAEELTVTCKQTKSTDASKVHGRYALSLNGADHEGIVHSIASYLHDHQINIESLETGVTNAPEFGTPLFNMHAMLQVPSSVTLEDLRNKLNEIARQEAVDIKLESKEVSVVA